MRAFALVAAVAPLVRAFSDSHPLVAWSTESTWSLNVDSTGMQSADSVAAQLSSAPGLCDHDSIFVIHYPGLHVSDLQLLPTSSEFSSAITKAPSSALVPHLVAPSSHLAQLPSNISTLCNAPLGSSLAPRTPGKHIVHFRLKPIQSVSNGSARRAEVAETTARLARELAQHPSHLAVLVGTRAPAPNAKQGLFHRYQFLTPGVITVLLVVLGVLVPFLLFGVSTIATIKSPLTGESFKPVTAQKKNQ
ncbi:hypothetical protein EXIGLDRAFT_755632 [Exidia glandulosa HHB12029]|uniref:Protein BIG1 n=1 Tax=Exidia glandulosa HHB12029 TaxID=1314781 RepID=A0A165ZC00_EXIGL|nr:hypothetical protein EXIGLDRAFT_755632 [Exidia glandulosa HHB12029]